MKFSRYNRYSCIGTRIIRSSCETSCEITCTFMLRNFCYTKKYIYFLVNGDGEIRTLDPLLARQVLSQLSYTPIHASICMRNGLKWTRTTDLTLIRRAL